MKVWYYEDSLPPHPFFLPDPPAGCTPLVEIPDDVLARHKAAWKEWQAACDALEAAFRAASQPDAGQPGNSGGSL
jgi:hypothetical protein